MSISAQDNHPRKQVDVLDSQMSYVDTGQGPATVVFLHGNPTSSYLWRNVIEQVKPAARCLAPDLIGMGRSGKSSRGYTYLAHRDYLDAWFDAVVDDEKVFLVLHDWGSGLGFHWAHRHPDQVLGMAYMEAIVGPVTDWDAWPEQAVAIFKALRSPAGEEMVLRKNLFVEAILPASIIRKLSEEEMTRYREPFTEPGESRRPTLTWPRQIPIAGEPAEVHDLISAYSAWLAESTIPKLFVDADPGTILTGPHRDYCRNFKNQKTVTVPGLHFIQEDSPVEIGQAVRALVSERLDAAP